MRCLAWNHELLDERDEWSSCQCQARQEIAEKRYERQPQTDSARTAGKTQLDVLSVLAFSLAGQRSTSMANEHALARPAQPRDARNARGLGAETRTTHHARHSMTIQIIVI